VVGGLQGRIVRASAWTVPVHAHGLILVHDYAAGRAGARAGAAAEGLRGADVRSGLDQHVRAAGKTGVDALQRVAVGQELGRVLAEEVDDAAAVVGVDRVDVQGEPGSGGGLSAVAHLLAAGWDDVAVVGHYGVLAGPA